MHKTKNSLKQTKNQLLSIICSQHAKREKVKTGYISKLHSEDPNQVILLMITNSEKFITLQWKAYSRLLQGIKFSRDGDYYCMHCLIVYSEQKAKLKCWSLKKKITLSNVIKKKNLWRLQLISIQTLNQYLKKFIHVITI